MRSKGFKVDDGSHQGEELFDGSDLQLSSVDSYQFNHFRLLISPSSRAMDGRLIQSARSLEIADTCIRLVS